MSYYDHSSIINEIFIAHFVDKNVIFIDVVVVVVVIVVQFVCFIRFLVFVFSRLSFLAFHPVPLNNCSKEDF